MYNQKIKAAKDYIFSCIQLKKVRKLHFHMLCLKIKEHYMSESLEEHRIRVFYFLHSVPRTCHVPVGAK